MTIEWHKSSRSGGGSSGGDCVELGKLPEWRKSSRSGGGTGGGGGDCVEIGELHASVGIRDSKNPDAGYLEIDRAELAGLLGAIKAGRYEL
ncbi:DUF397 domain-containing protein [Spirillospora sp. NPDC047279]|uniref:DUF397 domain-containing protein n=1 Tax=Spirillospora sp. NPDC047279 TaxID=3155478 RepID=UPI00340261FB